MPKALNVRELLRIALPYFASFAIEDQQAQFRNFTSDIAIGMGNICRKANGVALGKTETLVCNYNFDLSGENGDILLGAVQVRLCRQRSRWLDYNAIRFKRGLFVKCKDGVVQKLSIIFFQRCFFSLPDNTEFIDLSGSSIFRVGKDEFKIVRSGIVETL